MTEQAKSSIDPEEVERFSEWSQQWWDETGPFAPLHKFNPTRLRYIRDRVTKHFGRDKDEAGPLDGLTLLDIGCGGGLVCEPMARLGAAVTGIDAVEKNVGIAATHAEESGLGIEYRLATAEELAAGHETFDIVLTLEVIEHVAEPGSFMADCARLVKPGGCLVAATLNRTARAFALAIVGAEYILRWLPRGTHDWNKFIRPGELGTMVEEAGLTVEDIRGVTFNPLRDEWRLSKDTGVNYMIFATAAQQGRNK